MSEVRVRRSELIRAHGSFETELMICEKLKDIPKSAFVERIDYSAANEIVFRWEVPQA